MSGDHCTDPLALINANCGFLDSLLTGHPYLELPKSVTDRVVRSLLQIRQRLAATTLNVAVVGGFSAGKSTLMNALLGRQILASRPTPTTICPTRIAYADNKEVVVVREALREEQPRSVRTKIPSDVTLSGSFLPTGPAKMEPSGDLEYVATHTFGRAGVYPFEVRLGGETAIRSKVPVPRPSQTVTFVYSLLGNAVSTCAAGLDSLWIPGSKLPQVTVRSDQGTYTVTLRDVFYGGRWSAVVDLPPGVARLELSLPLAWLSKELPTRLERRPLGTWLGRLRALLQPSFRWQTVANEWSLIPLSLLVPNNGQTPAKYVVHVDVREKRFGVSPAPPGEGARRIFSIEQGTDLALVGKLVSSLTSAARESSSDRDFAGTVNSVTVSYPSPVLRVGLTLIDTPGIASDSRHTQKTVDVIREEADACLFLCPADQAGTMADLDFVKRYVLENSGDIIFVVTKADKAATQDEIDEITAVVAKKLRIRLGVANPRIYAVSAREALLDPTSKGAARFAGFVKDVAAFTAGNRKSIIIRHLVKVESEVMRELGQLAEARRARYEAQLAQLRDLVIEDLESFIAREEVKLNAKIDALYAEQAYISRMLASLERIVAHCALSLRQKVMSTKSKQELRNVCEKDVKDALQALTEKVVFAYHQLVSELDGKLAPLAAGVLNDFEASFEQHYPLHRITGVRIQLGSAPLPDLTPATSHTEAELAIVDHSISQSAASAGWGAGAGALLGTFVLPGVGTVIGGIIGGIVGNLFGPPLEKVQSQVVQALDLRTRDFVRLSLEPSVKALVRDRKTRMAARLTAGVGRYMQVYGDTVAHLIQEHERQKERVDSYVRSCGELSRDLAHRISQLREVGAAPKGVDGLATPALPSVG